MSDGTERLEPLPASELQRRAISGSTWTAAHTVVSLPVAFVANAIVARSLGVTSYGDLAFLAASLGLAFAFANLGFSVALIQRASGTEAHGRRDETDALLRKSLGFHTVVELPMLLLVALVLTRGEPAWETAAVGAAVIFTCVLSGAALGITIENRTAAGAKLAIAVNLCLQASTVAFAVVTSSASAVWAVRTLVPAAALVFSLLLLDRRRRTVVLRPRLPLGLGGRFWKFALASWLSGIVGLLVFSRSEIFLLQAFDKTAALGLFALAFGLAGQITAPVDAMLHALTPAVAGILAAWPERAARTFERSMRVSALLAGGVAAVVVPALVFAIPFIYGDGFREAAWLFVPLGFVSAFQSTNNPVIAFVNGRQRGGLILKANTAALVVNVALGVALIPPLGAWGAVAANVVGQLVALLALALTEPLAVERGARGVAHLYRPYFVGVAGGSAALVTGALLQSTSEAVALTACLVVGSVFFVGAVRFLRFGLTSDDRDALVGAVGVRAQKPLARLLKPLTTTDG